MSRRQKEEYKNQLTNRVQSKEVTENGGCLRRVTNRGLIAFSLLSDSLVQKIP
jgi:hypothetical protein